MDDGVVDLLFSWELSTSLFVISAYCSVFCVGDVTLAILSRYLQTVATTHALSCYYEPPDRSLALVGAVTPIAHIIERILTSVHIFKPLQHKDLKLKVNLFIKLLQPD